MAKKYTAVKKEDLKKTEETAEKKVEKESTVYTDHNPECETKACCECNLECCNEGNCLRDPCELCGCGDCGNCPLGDDDEDFEEPELTSDAKEDTENCANNDSEDATMNDKMKDLYAKLNKQNATIDRLKTEKDRLESSFNGLVEAVGTDLDDLRSDIDAVNEAVDTSNSDICESMIENFDSSFQHTKEVEDRVKDLEDQTADLKIIKIAVGILSVVGICKAAVKIASNKDAIKQLLK